MDHISILLIGKKQKKQQEILSICFLQAVIVTLNYKEIKKGLQRMTKIKPFIDKCNWEGINIPSGKDDWKKLEKNNVTIALKVLFAKKEKIYPAYFKT